METEKGEKFERIKQNKNEIRTITVRDKNRLYGLRLRRCALSKSGWIETKVICKLTTLAQQNTIERSCNRMRMRERESKNLTDLIA